MNFLLEQIIYFIINFILNPIRFLKRLNNIKTLPFGREVYKIEIIENKIFKYYRNRHSYYKNLNYYQLMKDYDFIPKNLYYDNNKFLIIQEFKGNLLTLTELNDNPELKKSLISLFDKLIKEKIIVRDIYPLFFNKNVINNLTVFDNKIYLIDYGDMVLSSKIEAEIFYTQLKKFYNII